MKKLLLSLLLLPLTVSAAEKPLTIIHFNDLHSRFQGVSPTLDFTPATLNDDKVLGGWSRISTLNKQIRSERQHQVLGLNAGDFSMGTLFHMRIRETGFELKLMKDIGVDITTLGNHEFDLGPQGLANILDSAYKYPSIPELVYSNIVFDSQSAKDDTLEAAFEKYQIPPYLIKEVNGVKIGFYGMMGIDAAEVAPFAKPVSFADPVETSRDMVKQLRDVEKVDVVVFISHGGIWEDKAVSEDELVAQQVDGIDIIISGHTAEPLYEPIFVNDTVIVHAGAYGKNLGVIDFVYDDATGELKQTQYKLFDIDDSIAADPDVQQQIEQYAKEEIEPHVLAQQGLTFNQVVAETDYPLSYTKAESNIGNLIADAIRWYINENGLTEDKVDFAVATNGLIRDDILPGESGGISVADAFGVLPLGIGSDDSMAYPIVSFYVTAKEIKDALEVITTVVPIKGEDFYLHISGLAFTYNPNRMLFDRVTSVRIGDATNGYQELDYSDGNTKLYRVASNYYNAAMLSLIESFTKGILVVTPKDKSGKPMQELKQAVLHQDPLKLREAKEWQAFIRYMQSFDDVDGNGVANLPEHYRGIEGRIVVEPSWNPVKLLARPAVITQITAAVVGLFLIVLLLLIYRRLSKS